MASAMQLSASLSDWRLVYRMLLERLRDSDELMSCDLMEQLQRRLHEAARDDGVDIRDHAQWDAWLRRPRPAGPKLELVD